jgi:hypothetical protein
MLEKINKKLERKIRQGGVDDFLNSLFYFDPPVYGTSSKLILCQTTTNLHAFEVIFAFLNSIQF